MIRIVHIDDSEDYLALIRSLFYQKTDGSEFELLQLSDPHELLNQVDSLVVDVIISDYDMPGLNGIALYQSLNRLGHSIPFIILTGKSSEEVVMDSLNAGIDYYLEKGVNTHVMFSQLLNFISKAVEQKRTLEKLILAEKLYQKAFETAPMEIVITRRTDGLVFDVNEHAIKRFRRKKEEIVGKTVVDAGLLTQEQREEGLRQWGGRYGEIFEAPSYPLLDEPMIGEFLIEKLMLGEEEYMIQMVKNLTPREGLKKSWTLQKRLLDLLHAIVLVLDLNGRVMYGNKTIRQLWCLKEDDPLPKFVYDHETILSQTSFETRMEEIVSKGHASFIVEDDILDKKVTLEINANLIDLDGQRIVVAVGHEISKRMEREKSLLIKEKSIEHSLDAQALADLEGNLFYVNLTFLEMWGYERKEDVLGRPAIDFWASKEKASQVIDALSTSGSYVGNLEARHRSGANFMVRLVANMINDDGGNPICLQSSFHDITQNVKAQEVLQSQREELSEFAHSMAHDLRNHLYKINGMLILLAEKYEVAVDDIVPITDLVNDIETIMTNALKLAEEGLIVGEAEETDLNEVINNVLFIFKDSLVTFEVADLPKVYADRNKIFQVVKNIVENALFHGLATLIEFAITESNNGLDLLISNNGKQISPEILQTIKNFQGTGFGYRIILKVLDGLGWTLNIESDITKTTVIISIPFSSIIKCE